jgi:hypothetical protein
VRYVQIKSFDKHLENPFVEQTIQDFSTRTKRLIAGDPNHLIISKDTGEITGQMAFMTHIEVDEEKFTKIFTSEIQSLFNLSSNAVKVFAYILSILRPNQDKVLIRIDDCKIFTGYKSESAIRTGLAILIKNNFIARTKYNDEYFINPMIFFNGNRVSFVRQYVKKNHQEKGEIGLLEEGEEGRQEKKNYSPEEVKERRRRAAVLLGKTDEEFEKWAEEKMKDKNDK